MFFRCIHIFTILHKTWKYMYVYQVNCLRPVEITRRLSQYEATSRHLSYCRPINCLPQNYGAGNSYSFVGMFTSMSPQYVQMHVVSCRMTLSDCLSSGEFLFLSQTCMPVSRPTRFEIVHFRDWCIAIFVSNSIFNSFLHRWPQGLTQFPALYSEYQMLVDLDGSFWI